MDLQSAFLMTCPGRPHKVKSNCQLSESGQVNLYADAGLDIEADHGAFDFVIEVSGQKHIDDNIWRKQIKDNKPGWTRAALLAVLEGNPFPGEEEARERAALGGGAEVEVRAIEPCSP